MTALNRTLQQIVDDIKERAEEAMIWEAFEMEIAHVTDSMGRPITIKIVAERGFGDRTWKWRASKTPDR